MEQFDAANSIQDLQYFGEFGGVNPSISDSSTYTFLSAKTMFEREITQFPEVQECFHVSGDYDYILKITVRDIQEYRNFMVTKLTNLQHIASTQSSFIIKEVKSTTAVNME